MTEDGGVRPDFQDLVQFSGRGCPAFAKALHDRVLGLDVFYRHRHVLLMAHSGHTQQFAPFIGDFIRCTIAVHGAVQNHGRHTRIPVSRGDPLYKGLVANGTETFVMHNHVKILDPVLLLVNRDFVGPPCAALVEDRPGHIGPFADALADNQLLLGVIMAAAAGNEQGFEWFGRLSDGSLGAQSEQSEEFHDRYYLCKRLAVYQATRFTMPAPA